METTFIYTLEFPLTNEVKYVGKSNNIKNRVNQHVYRVKQLNEHLHEKDVWIKNLLDNKLKPLIRILDEVPLDEWDYWERYWILQMMSWGFNLTNIRKGGNGYGFHPKETIEKIRKSLSGVNNPMYGKPGVNLGKKMGAPTEETKRKISEVKKGMKNVMYGKAHSEETKRKMSEIKKGRPTWNKGVAYTDEQKEKIIGHLTDEGRKKLSECGKKMEGRKRSEETKRKISETRKRKGLKPPSNKGCKMSEETKQKICIKALERERIKRENKD